MAVLEIIDDDGHAEVHALARRIRTTSPDDGDHFDSAAAVLAPPPRIRTTRLDDIASPERSRVVLLDSSVDVDSLLASPVAPPLRRAADLAPPRRSRTTSLHEVDHPDSATDVLAPPPRIGTTRLDDADIVTSPARSRIALMDYEDADIATSPARSGIALMDSDDGDISLSPARTRIALMDSLDADITTSPAGSRIALMDSDDADSRPASRITRPLDAASARRRAAALRRTADLVGAFLFIPPLLRRQPRHFEADEPESSARPATSRSYAGFYDLDLPILLGAEPFPPWWRRRALEVFTEPDPTLSTNAVAPTPTPPQAEAIVEVPQPPAPPSRGRAVGGRRRGRSTPPPVARPSPVLTLGTGPAPGVHVGDYIFRRWWDVAVELEELLTRYDMIRELENTPYTRKATVQRLWDAFHARLEICRCARREIKKLRGEPPFIPEELFDEYFGISCRGSWV